MPIGNMIKKLRRERNLTQDQLASLVNVTSQAVSRWETNAAMPDISLLVPLAHIFHVSTDTLLEVNVEEMDREIRQILDRTLDYGKDADKGFGIPEKTQYLRDAVRRFPESVALKDRLYTYLTFSTVKDGAFADPAVFREQASLLEDMLELGGTKTQEAVWKNQLCYVSRRLGQTDRIRGILHDAPVMDLSKEVLLPNQLTGREQIEARKELIFKCTDTIIQTVQTMYEENAGDLTAEEWAALKGPAKVIETVYGKNFGDCFELVDRFYSRVSGALKRGQTDEAAEGLEEIIRRLRRMETEPGVTSPLISDEQFSSLCLMHYTTFTLSHFADQILKALARDISPESEASCDPRLPAIRAELERLKKTEHPVFDEWCSDWFADYLIGKKGSLQQKTTK